MFSKNCRVYFLRLCGRREQLYPLTIGLERLHSMAPAIFYNLFAKSATYILRNNREFKKKNSYRVIMDFRATSWGTRSQFCCPNSFGENITTGSVWSHCHVVCVYCYW